MKLSSIFVIAPAMAFFCIIHACDTGGNNCFPAGTKIETPTGDINVESIRIGDEVLAFDFETQMEVTTKVVQTHVHENDNVLIKIYLDDGSDLSVTPEHPLYSMTRGDWVKAGTLVRGDQLRIRGTQDGVSEVGIKQLSSGRNTAKVYNLETGSPGNYFAGKILAKYY